MQSKTYSVYVHTAPSGEKYVGITRVDPKDRWKNGLGYKSQYWFYTAIQKYGFDSFTHEVVYTGLTKEEAEQTEKELIDKYHSWCPGFGFNDTAGGSCHRPLKPIIDKETRKVYGTVRLAMLDTGATQYAVMHGGKGRFGLFGVGDGFCIPMPLYPKTKEGD